MRQFTGGALRAVWLNKWAPFMITILPQPPPCLPRWACSELPPFCPGHAFLSFCTWENGPVSVLADFSQCLDILYPLCPRKFPEAFKIILRISKHCQCWLCPGENSTDIPRAGHRLTIQSFAPSLQEVWKLPPIAASLSLQKHPSMADLWWFWWWQISPSIQICSLEITMLVN